MSCWLGPYCILFLFISYLASQLFCSLYKKVPCGCIQKYICGQGKNLRFLYFFIHLPLTLKWNRPCRITFLFLVDCLSLLFTKPLFFNILQLLATHKSNSKLSSRALEAFQHLLYFWVQIQNRMILTPRSSYHWRFWLLLFENSFFKVSKILV